MEDKRLPTFDEQVTSFKTFSNDILTRHRCAVESICGLYGLHLEYSSAGGAAADPVRRGGMVKEQRFTVYYGNPNSDDFGDRENLRAAWVGMTVNVQDSGFRGFSDQAFVEIYGGGYGEGRINGGTTFASLKGIKYEDGSPLKEDALRIDCRNPEMGLSLLVQLHVLKCIWENLSNPQLRILSKQLLDDIRIWSEYEKVIRSGDAMEEKHTLLAQLAQHSKSPERPKGSFARNLIKQVVRRVFG